MWINLDRLAVCHSQEQFLLLSPGWFTVHTFILSYLIPAEGHRFLRTCIILLVDRRELFLSATALRLNYLASGYSVPTPPLQPFLILSQVGAVATVWDQDISEDDLNSSASHNLSGFSGSNAVEVENLDTFQEE